MNDNGCQFSNCVFLFLQKSAPVKAISKEIIIQFIRERRIELSSTQTKLCLSIINRIFKKMSAGIKFMGIKVENGLICDGHHRYIASLLANVPLEKIPGNLTGATVVVDWDTPGRIYMLNQQDAEYNNVEIEEIIELLK